MGHLLVFLVLITRLNLQSPQSDLTPWILSLGEPLYTIVDDFADNPQQWHDEFWPALHKMLANGYSDADLTVNGIDLLNV